MRDVILFDMDGTLTPPRQKMPIDIEIMLKEIQEAGFEIGIITGSGMNYVRQQCSGLFDLGLANLEQIHFLPCNGTKYFYNNKKVYEYDMREEVGVNVWRMFLAYLFQLQNKLIIENLGNLPLTGTFFDYRGSMLNWCPIGRNASSRERILWEKLNKDELIRTPILNQINSYLNRGNKINLTAKLGGDTSFDIFPRGWDKTFPIDKMNMFSDCNVYFIGDRCHESGNDYELYNHPKTTAYQTTSIEDTIKIVNKIISSNV
tara:strand:+ start:673 stop:1452 length:780 start_codon:yes stop_codon:yes gene_type:complete